jgi:hypothetical protein
MVIFMDYCNACPYPAKCAQRARCQMGREVVKPVAPAPIISAKPKAQKKKVSK